MVSALGKLRTTTIRPRKKGLGKKTDEDINPLLSIKFDNFCLLKGKVYIHYALNYTYVYICIQSFVAHWLG